MCHNVLSLCAQCYICKGKRNSNKAIKHILEAKHFPKASAVMPIKYLEITNKDQKSLSLGIIKLIIH